MDTTSLPVIVMSVFSLLQPYLSIISNKAAEKVGEKIPDYIDEIWHKITTMFSDSQSGKESIDDLITDPENLDVQAAFRVQLSKILERDEKFRREIIELIGKNSTKEAYNAKVIGSGAIAQGKGAKSVGANGILVDGNNNTIETKRK